MKAIVGLGNPGKRYARTRHNLGNMAAHAFLRRLADIAKTEHDFARVYRRGQILVVEPLVYMNLSGVAVQEVCEAYEIAPRNLLIVYDDYALPFGRLSAKAAGGAGGHHGMQSVIAALQTKEIPRLKLGIGTAQPLHELTDYVLERFSPAEEAQLSEILQRAAEAIECFVQSNIETVMNRFNAR